MTDRPGELGCTLEHHGFALSAMPPAAMGGNAAIARIKIQIQEVELEARKSSPVATRLCVIGAMVSS